MRATGGHARSWKHRHLEAEARRNRKGFYPADILQRLRGRKASNPVISTDGRFMAFQSARTTDAAGVDMAFSSTVSNRSRA